MKIIEDENYKIIYNSSEKNINFSGTLRLGGLAEYAPIVECLEEAVSECDSLIVSLKELEFLNSSGIAMLSKFVINARNKPGFSLSLVGSKETPWQGKSLNNLQRLMPALSLDLE
jgi:hypothetical protein